jgi:hypothetical protein
LQRQLLQFSSLIILLLTSAPFSLNSRHTLRRAHRSSNDFIEFALEQQNASDSEAENYVSSIIILHVMADSYASNFY